MALTQAQLVCLSQKRPLIVPAYAAQGWNPSDLGGIFANWWGLPTNHGMTVGDSSAQYATIEEYATALGCTPGASAAPVGPTTGTAPGLTPVVGGAFSKFFDDLKKQWDHDPAPLVIAAAAAVFFLMKRRG